VDGKSNKRIGDFSGSPILALEQKINGFPVMQSYGHMNVDSGSFVTYVFDGKKYQVVSSVFIGGQSVKDLFKSLNSYRKIKVAQDKKGR
jgi:hypothetical protein